MRTDTGGEHFLGDCAVAMRSGETGAQRLQHLAISLVLDAFRQRRRLNGSASKNIFHGSRIDLATEGGADFRRHHSARRRVLQRMRLFPLRGKHRRQRLGRSLVALCGGKLAAHRLQHLAVGIMFDALRQSYRLCSGTVQYAFNRCRICLATEGGADLLRHRSAGRGIL